jgi:hypothetical protein
MYKDDLLKMPLFGPNTALLRLTIHVTMHGRGSHDFQFLGAQVIDVL